MIFGEHNEHGYLGAPIAKHVIETYFAKKEGTPLPVLTPNGRRQRRPMTGPRFAAGAAARRRRRRRAAARSSRAAIDGDWPVD